MTRLALALAGLAAGFVVLLAGPAVAQPPVVEAGDCLYLVGAPPGAPAAETEERTGISQIYDECTVPAQVDFNRDGDNMIQAWVDGTVVVPPLAEHACDVVAAVGHSFRASAGLSSVTRSWVTMRGELLASLDNRLSANGNASYVRAYVAVSEITPTGAAIVARRDLVERRVTTFETQLLDTPFGAGVAVDLRPGREYRAELVIEIDARQSFLLLDFGTPGSGRWARYTSLEVCVGAGGLAAGGDEDLSHLEHALYERECYPGIWLPEEHGGQLGAARDLVATRLSQALASGARGVHADAAQRSLDRADAEAEVRDYQQACRSLVQALHALTTP